MATSVQMPTAQIFQFPLNGRRVASAFAREAAQIVASPRLPDVDFGSWYHQAAIVDSETTRKS